MGSTFGRLSFIILMLQLFGITKWRRVALWTLFYAQLIPNSIVVITLYIQCKDVRALWDFSIKSSCWPEDLQTVRVIMKIVYLEALADRGDYTYNTVPLFVWVQVESTLVVIASSVPLLRPLFLQVKSSTTHNRTHSVGHTYELSNYTKKKSLPSNHVFSMISDEEASQKKENDTGSEVQILPNEQEIDSWKGIKKEITYSVKVDDLGAIDIEKGEKQEQDHDSGRTTPWLERQLMKRTSKGSVEC
ncbi:integral membrane protein [Rutstroemia sp. NJR-2017a BBW]|nr:integral membrane protein [Rutstroemia sp. NJR-2017a BBW]